MAVRLYMNLGLLAESERLPDSADTVVVVEPNIGSTSRTKGYLYLLVTSKVGEVDGKVDLALNGCQILVVFEGD